MSPLYCSIEENQNLSLPRMSDSPNQKAQDLRLKLAKLTGEYADVMSAYDSARAVLDASYQKSLAQLNKFHTEKMGRINEDRKTVLGELLALKLPHDAVDDLFLFRNRQNVSLADTIYSTIYEHGPISKADIRVKIEAGGQIEIGSGRTFHLTLMNVAKSGKIKVLPDGNYVHTSGSKFGSDPENKKGTLA